MTIKQQIGSSLIVFAVAFLWVTGFGILHPNAQKPSPSKAYMPRFSRTSDLNNPKMQHKASFQLPRTPNGGISLRLGFDRNKDWWTCEYIAESPGTCVFRV